MEGSQPNPSNADPWKFVMEFNSLLDAWFFEITGYYRIMVEGADGKPQEIYAKDVIYLKEEVMGLDGKPATINYVKSQDNTESLCNIGGGKYIVHKLGLYFNKAAAMGSLREDEPGRVAGQATRQIFGNMLPEDDKWQIHDMNAFVDEALSVQDSLRLFFTSIKKAGIRDWGQSILAIKIGQQSMATDGQPKNRSFLDKIRGSKDI